MRPAILFLLAIGSMGFEAPTGRAMVAERSLEAMVSIPAGKFIMGASKEAQDAAIELCKKELGRAQERMCRPELLANEGPQKAVYLSAFQIDRVEVTVAAYRGCVRAGVCAPQPLFEPDQRFLGPSLPITSVTWPEAAQYCAWRGARLPSEAEWERAARGRNERTWPWGNIGRAGASNHGRLSTQLELSPTPYTMMQPDPSDGFAFLAPVGSYPEGASADGVLDLAGNALEWTADVYQNEPPQTLSTVNPRGPQTGNTRAVRGGSWRQPRLFHRTTARGDLSPEVRLPEVGFRCAK